MLLMMTCVGGGTATWYWFLHIALDQWSHHSQYHKPRRCCRHDLLEAQQTPIHCLWWIISWRHIGASELVFSLPPLPKPSFLGPFFWTKRCIWKGIFAVAVPWEVKFFHTIKWANGMCRHGNVFGLMRILKLFAANQNSKQERKQPSHTVIFQPYVNFQAFFTLNSECIAICPVFRAWVLRRHRHRWHKVLGFGTSILGMDTDGWTASCW